MSFLIRSYQPPDFETIYTFWEVSMGASWPLTPEFLRRSLGERGADHLVAEQDGRIVGFVATHTDAVSKEGRIPLIMVHPDHQRQGIGRQLQAAAVARFREQNMETLSLGHGSLWPGVPLDDSGAADFFRACGWQLLDTNYDLTRDLTAYQTPAGVLDRVAEQGIALRLAVVDEVAAVLAFEDQHFPFWSEYFRLNVDAGSYANILCAWDGSQVVGSLLLDASMTIWHKLLGDDMGSIGTVGVEESYQGRGIGLALVAKASELLQARGVRQCIIGWTDLTGFYGKLGYTVWRSYGMTDEP